jgi:hypothetical protein
MAHARGAASQQQDAKRHGKQGPPAISHRRRVRPLQRLTRVIHRVNLGAADRRRRGRPAEGLDALSQCETWRRADAA